jgi:hypothetical protein
MRDAISSSATTWREEELSSAFPQHPAHRIFAQFSAAPWAGGHAITVDQNETTWLQVKFAAHLLQIAMQGGYLARKNDPAPGNMVVWRGMTRLHGISFGISIGSRRRCG